MTFAARRQGNPYLAVTLFLSERESVSRRLRHYALKSVLCDGKTILTRPARMRCQDDRSQLLSDGTHERSSRFYRDLQAEDVRRLQMSGAVRRARLRSPNTLRALDFHGRVRQRHRQRHDPGLPGQIGGR